MIRSHFDPFQSKSVFPPLRPDSSARCSLDAGEKNNVSSFFPSINVDIGLMAAAKADLCFRSMWLSSKRRGEPLPGHKRGSMFLLTKLFVSPQNVVYSDLKIKPSAEAPSSSRNKCADSAPSEDVTYSEVLVLCKS